MPRQKRSKLHLSLRAAKNIQSYNEEKKRKYEDRKRFLESPRGSPNHSPVKFHVGSFYKTPTNISETVCLMVAMMILR